MKKLIFITLAFFSISLNAQDTSVVAPKDTTIVVPKDTTVFDIGNTKIIIVASDKFEDLDSTSYDLVSNKNDLTFWDGIDIGVNGYFFGEEYDFSSPDGQEYLEINYAGSKIVFVATCPSKIEQVFSFRVFPFLKLLNRFKDRSTLSFCKSVVL